MLIFLLICEVDFLSKFKLLHWWLLSYFAFPLYLALMSNSRILDLRGLRNALNNTQTLEEEFQEVPLCAALPSDVPVYGRHKNRC